MAPDYPTRAWAAADVCRPLDERSVDDVRTYVTLEMSVYIATPIQRARARGEVLYLLVRGCIAHEVRNYPQARELARKVQTALGHEADDITTAGICDALMRRLPEHDLHTILARRSLERMSGWRADRIGR
jgi:hypothetical protein